MSKAFYDRSLPSLKSVLLHGGFEGSEEDEQAFAAALDEGGRLTAAGLTPSFTFETEPRRGPAGHERRQRIAKKRQPSA